MKENGELNRLQFVERMRVAEYLQANSKDGRLLYDDGVAAEMATKALGFAVTYRNVYSIRRLVKLQPRRPFRQSGDELQARIARIEEWIHKMDPTWEVK